MKRLLWVIMAVGLAAGIAVLVVFWNVGQTGSGSIEQWIGQQLQSIAGSYLKPTLSFTDLDYEYPATVRLKKLRLSAADPSREGNTIDIVGADDVTLTLAELPVIGRPIRIERISLGKPLFHAVALTPGGKKFVGFSDLLRADVLTTQPSDTQPAEAQPSQSAAGAPPKLSEVFQIRLIELTDGRIVYDPRIDGTAAMELDQINTKLTITPSDAGLYDLATKITRSPLFDLAINGKLDLDHFAARDVVVNLKAELGDKQQDYLPPELQRILKQYQVRGSLDARITGSMPIMDPLKGAVQAEVSLNDAFVSAGSYRVPVKKLDLAAEMNSGRLLLPAFRLEAQRGEVNCAGYATLNELLDADFTLRVKDLFLEDALVPTPGAAPALAGRVNAEVHAAAPIRVVLAKLAAARQPPPPMAASPATLPTTSASPSNDLATASLPTVWGNGRFNIDQALLVRLPLVADLTSLINKGATLLTFGQRYEEARSDTASIVFELTGDGARLDKIEYSSPAIGIRGNGFVMLDRRLFLKLTGGPLEKMRSLLGDQIGGAIASVGNVAAYRVTGVIADPQVEVELGGTEVGKGARDVGEGILKGLGGIGEGIGKLGEKLR